MAGQLGYNVWPGYAHIRELSNYNYWLPLKRRQADDDLNNKLFKV